MNWQEMAPAMGVVLIISGIVQSFIITAIRARDMRNAAERGGSEYIFGIQKWSFRTSNPGIVMIVVGAFLLGLSPFFPHGIPN